MATKRFEPAPMSASGDFYVEYQCCTSCGVPQHVAPDLVGWIDEGMNHCYWKKQPETPAELEQAFRIFRDQELVCHRYAGSDPAIQARIGTENCDQPVSWFDSPTNPLAPNKPSGFAPAFKTFDEPNLLQRLWSKLFRAG